MEIAILVTLIVGFIITWIVCSKMSDTSEFDYKPDKIMMINPYNAEKESLKMQVYALEQKLYSAHREIDYWRGGKYDRPVEVNIDLKVETNEQNVSVS